ncbi:MAG: hypothetical protein OXU42_03200 [Deltaproteobacteria bacterium]|nr:hypothetical protein [Deltaproteobacteria bacterium]
MEQDLARALSRHIGYTTGAYYLERIVSTLSAFDDAPSAYITELVEKARLAVSPREASGGNTKALSQEYLEEVINFAEAMGLLETVSPKQAQVRRFAPTEVGRTLLGAKGSEDESFFHYYLTKTVLFADSDALFPVIDFFSRARSESLHAHYLAFQQGLRARRAKWLLEAFPEQLLFKRIALNVPWLRDPQRGEPRPRIEELSVKTAKHHTTPRHGWLSQLGLLDAESKALTPFGAATRRSLTPDGHYFWLGPKQTTQRDLGISLEQRLPGPFEDTYGMAAEYAAPTNAEIDQLIADTVHIMKRGYKSVKLIHAAQATLLLPIEYIKYRMFADGRSYRWAEVLSALFPRYRVDFERLSAKRGQIGFYKWKGVS